MQLRHWIAGATDLQAPLAPQPSPVTKSLPKVEIEVGHIQVNCILVIIQDTWETAKTYME